jgi:hypothetical protein
MDPATIAALAGAAGGAAKPGGPSNSDLAGDFAFDSSGWNINFGGGSIESSRAQDQGGTNYVPYVVAAAVVLIVWRMTRRKK